MRALTPLLSMVAVVLLNETGINALVEEWGLEKTGERSYRFVTDEAKRIAYLLDAIELVVLP